MLRCDRERMRPAIRPGVVLAAALSLALTGLNPAAAASDDWPQFRGPTGDGISPAKGLPLTWGEDKNILWKTAVPGRGRSSPVVLGDRIYLTTAVETGMRRYGSGADDMQQAERAVLGAACVERSTGKVLYHVDLFPHEKPEAVHWLNSYATPTPVVEPGRLFCDFGTFGTAAIDTDSGRPIWKRTLPLNHQVGPGSSPILHGGLLILVRDGRDQQYVTALDPKSGETVWKTERPPIRATTGDFRKSFSTPLIIEADGRTQMVVPGAQWIVSYDPATGKEIWRVDDGNGFSAAPRPVFGNGMVFVCTGNAGGRPQLWAIRVDGKGDVTSTHVAWKQNAGIPMVPSPVLVGQEIYIPSDEGLVACIDALTGKILEKHRLGENQCASPVSADGRIYFFGQEGTAVVLRAGKVLERLAENRLDGGPLFAAPAFAGGTIYIRTDRFLYCIRGIE